MVAPGGTLRMDPLRVMDRVVAPAGPTASCGIRPMCVGPAGQTRITAARAGDPGQLITYTTETVTETSVLPDWTGVATSLVGAAIAPP